MAIPVYDAVSYVDTMQGGSTKPWLITVDVDGKLEPYVLKIYTKKIISEYNAVYNESIVSQLLDYFELPTPKCALINLTDEFKSTLDNKRQKQLSETDNLPKFATKLIAPVFPYSPAKSYSKIELYQVGSIYAFDCMILNMDRNENKPNLLFDGKDDILLIDHELSLSEHVNKESYKYFINNYNYKRHLFYNNLKLVKTNKYGDLFDTFESYLLALDVDFLDETIYQLEDVGYNVDYSFRTKNFLNSIQSNAILFVSLVKGSLGND